MSTLRHVYFERLSSGLHPVHPWTLSNGTELRYNQSDQYVGDNRAP